MVVNQSTGCLGVWEAWCCPRLALQHLPSSQVACPRHLGTSPTPWDTRCSLPTWLHSTPLGLFPSAPPFCFSPLTFLKTTYRKGNSHTKATWYHPRRWCHFGSSYSCNNWDITQMKLRILPPNSQVCAPGRVPVSTERNDFYFPFPFGLIPLSTGLASHPQIVIIAFRNQISHFWNEFCSESFVFDTYAVSSLIGAQQLKVCQQDSSGKMVKDRSPVSTTIHILSLLLRLRQCCCHLSLLKVVTMAGLQLFIPSDGGYLSSEIGDPWLYPFSFRLLTRLTWIAKASLCQWKNNLGL